MALFTVQFDTLIGVATWYEARVAASYCETLGHDATVTLLDQSAESLEPLAQSYRVVEDFAGWIDGIAHFTDALQPYLDRDRRHPLMRIPFPTDWAWWRRNPMAGIHWWKWRRGRSATYRPDVDELLANIAAWERQDIETKTRLHDDWCRTLTWAHSACHYDADLDWGIALNNSFNISLREVARVRGREMWEQAA